MPESRDRLVRTIEMAAGFGRWPLVFGSNLFERPRMQEAQVIGDGTAAIRIQREDSIRTTRNLYKEQGGRNLWWMRKPSVIAIGTPATTRGSCCRGRGVNSVLPSWYPRTPLRDITMVTRAYDGRKRLSRLRDGCKDRDLITKGCSSPGSLSGDDALLKHDDASVFVTPYQRSSIAESCKQSVCKIHLDVVNMKFGNDSEFLTPQRKLLNEIDSVQEVVLDGIRQFNETPLAKRAERERKVRVLMSMR